MEHYDNKCDCMRSMHSMYSIAPMSSMYHMSYRLTKKANRIAPFLALHIFINNT